MDMVLRIFFLVVFVVEILFCGCKGIVWLLVIRCIVFYLFVLLFKIICFFMNEMICKVFFLNN